jgi:hypothetical protein
MWHHFPKSEAMQEFPPVDELTFLALLRHRDGEEEALAAARTSRGAVMLKQGDETAADLR